MGTSAIAPDAASFIRGCLLDWKHERDAIETALGRRRGWRAVEEWRISTETEERIVRREGRFEVVSSCDATWRATPATVDDAAKVRALFWSLHPELFYSLGWPSWAAANRLDPAEPGGRMRRSDAQPYLARLSDAALDRLEDLGRRVSQEGDEYVARIALDPLGVESRSPTRERAAQFQGVYEQLLADAVACLALG